MGVLTLAASALGDAILVPISEVGSLAGGVGWLATCVAYLAARRDRRADGRVAWARAGGLVSVAIILMKIAPGVPGSFTRAEWISFVAWSGLGLSFGLLRRRSGSAST